MANGSVSIRVDFNERAGLFKPMHGVGQPPNPYSNSKYHYLTEAGIPYSRLHDVGGWFGGGLYVDIPNLFRDFDADENDPDSYDFTFTDRLLNSLSAAKCEPYFRLGVSIENGHMLKTYRLYPPKDFNKWARICEHVIRHYNEGWANGYHLGITYWEIWNEPDDCFEESIAAMWKGTPQQFFELYSITARHLKACFGDTIKVGGYGHCGVYEYKQDKNLCGIGHEDTYVYDFTISFMHGFLKYQRETNAPIDFFTWHVYDNCHESTKNDLFVITEHADYVRRILDKYGYTDTEHHLNEWNLNTDPEYRDIPYVAAKTLAFMLMMQNTSTDLMCYYDAKIAYTSYGAFLNPDHGHPYRAYYSFMMYNTLYRLKNAVRVESSDKMVFAAAGVDGGRAAIVISNLKPDAVTIKLDLNGFSANDSQVCRIDEHRRNTVTGESIENGEITIPKYSCMEIKLWSVK